MKNLGLATVFAMTAITVTSCSVERIDPPARLGCGPAGGSAAEDSIRESVLHTLVGLPMFRSPADTDSVKSYFIAITESDTLGSAEFTSDPSETLLARLRARVPKVEPVSRLAVGRDTFVDRDSGVRGVVFGVGEICYRGAQQVQVQAFRQLAPYNHYDFQFELTLISGTWQVTSWQITSVT